jgi:hypothetical protein
MPFKKSAKMLLVNEGKDTVKLYYDVDFFLQKLSPATLYFHAFWTKQMKFKLGDDFLVLPKVNGRSRYFEMTVDLNTDTLYKTSWWG